MKYNKETEITIDSKKNSTLRKALVELAMKKYGHGEFEIVKPGKRTGHSLY